MIWARAAACLVISQSKATDKLKMKQRDGMLKALRIECIYIVPAYVTPAAACYCLPRGRPKRRHRALRHAQMYTGRPGLYASLPRSLASPIPCRSGLSRLDGSVQSTTTSLSLLADCIRTHALAKVANLPTPARHTTTRLDFRGTTRLTGLTTKQSGFSILSPPDGSDASLPGPSPPSPFAPERPARI